MKSVKKKKLKNTWQREGEENIKDRIKILLKCTHEKKCLKSSDDGFRFRFRI